MYNIIPLVIILVCLVAILLIVVRKLSFLATFDVSEIPKEKEAETKEKIMEERLRRKIKFYYSKIAPFFKLLANFFQRKAKNLLEKLKNIEEQYKKKTKKEVLVTKEEFDDLEKQIADLLKEAEELTGKEGYSEAEKKYIKIISLDAKNIEAYRGLGNLYFLQKSYEEAKQTFAHILKLNKEDSFAFFELAEACYKLEDYAAALVNLDKALALEANNPKYLDLLLTICIIIKDKEKARDVLKKMREVNPDNKKIEEFEAQIQALK